jgi:hypothetical protein
MTREPDNNTGVVNLRTREFRLASLYGTVLFSVPAGLFVISFLDALLGISGTDESNIGSTFLFLCGAPLQLILFDSLVGCPSELAYFSPDVSLVNWYFILVVYCAVLLYILFRLGIVIGRVQARTLTATDGQTRTPTDLL